MSYLCFSHNCHAPRPARLLHAVPFTRACVFRFIQSSFTLDCYISALQKATECTIEEIREVIGQDAIEHHRGPKEPALVPFDPMNPAWTATVVTNVPAAKRNRGYGEKECSSKVSGCVLAARANDVINLLQHLLYETLPVQHLLHTHFCPSVML